MRLAAATAAAALGLLGLVAWNTQLRWLGTFGGGLQPMSPVTSIGLVILGGVLILGVLRPARRLLRGMALFVLAFACARLAAFWAGLPGWPDEWLFPSARAGTAPLGHVSPLSSLAFILAAAAVGLPAAGGVLASLLTLLSLVVLLGYALGTPLLYGGTVVPMALPTAVAFVALGVAVIAHAGPERLPLRPFSGPSVQAQLLRGFLPILVAIVVAECFLFRFDPGLNPALRKAIASMVLVSLVSAGGLRLARRVGGVVDAVQAERRQAERSLLASEAVLRQLIKHSPAAVAMFDTEMRYLQVSDRWLTDYHLDRQNVAGRSHYEVFPDIPDRWREVHLRVLAGAVESCAADEFVRADGSSEWVQWEARPWLTPGGAIGGITIFTQLVTEGRRAAAELVRLSRAIEQSAESVVITDPHGTIVYVNPAFTQVTGYAREEALGQNPRMLKSGQQDPEFYRQMWDTLVRGKTWTGQITNRRKDGTLLEEDAAISPVRDTSGQVINYVAVKRDITHEKSLEQQLLQAQKMEAVGRLAGGVAHDFNNIIGVILGYGEAVQKKLPPGDALADKVQQILRAAGRAADLTRQLLAFSRKQVLQPRALDLNETLADMEKMLRRLIGEDVELMLRPGPGLGAVRADPGQVEQILMNLALNARDAMPEGGQLAIETANADLSRPVSHGRSQLPAGRYVMLTVRDEGAGMSRDTEAHIFEPFFTTKGPGRGTGLGLSTVYGIVKQSEGFIYVHSELGKGTTFEIYLPRIDDSPAAPGRPVAASAPRGAETLLLVEDEPALRELLREVLEENGYTVLSAGEGAEALGTAERYPGRIDLLLTDVVMPGMTGPRLAQQFAATRPEAKVVYVSGYSEDAVASLSRLGPGAVLLSKPFAAEALLRTIRDVMDQRGADQPSPALAPGRALS